MALLLLVLFSVAFAATHIGMSHGALRARLVDKLGLWPFRGVYSLVSILTLGGAALLFWANRHAGPVLWTAPRWVAVLVSLPLMFLAMELLVLILGSPSPASLLPARAEVRAVLRITRHPMNMALACFSLAHLVGNGTLGDVSFFGSIFTVGFFGAFHQDRRIARERGEAYRAFLDQTSVLPFAAILAGRTRLDLGELSLPLLILGFLVFAALAVFHGALFRAPLL